MLLEAIDEPGTVPLVFACIERRIGLIVAFEFSQGLGLADQQRVIELNSEPGQVIEDRLMLVQRTEAVEHAVNRLATRLIAAVRAQKGRERCHMLALAGERLPKHEINLRGARAKRDPLLSVLNGTLDESEPQERRGEIAVERGFARPVLDSLRNQLDRCMEIAALHRSDSLQVLGVRLVGLISQDAIVTSLRLVEARLQMKRIAFLQQYRVSVHGPGSSSGRIGVSFAISPG